MRDVEGVINASPMGMTGQVPMPRTVLEALSLTAREAYVFDMVYSPLETDLLKEARRIRREGVDGLVMLIGQARFAFVKFFNEWPPEKFDAELRKLLTS